MFDIGLLSSVLVGMYIYNNFASPKQTLRENKIVGNSFAWKRYNLNKLFVSKINDVCECTYIA